MVEVSVEEFEQLVSDALDGIPDDLRRQMDNVAVMVDETIPPGPLLGLYEGIPLTRRGNYYTATLPDRITIYMATICQHCRTAAEVVETIRTTVIHEVAHHFGMSDQRLSELGWA